MVHLWLTVASRGLAEDANELEKKYMHPRSRCTAEGHFEIYFPRV